MQPPAHTLYTHSLHSLSLYQLGINLLKQRASWRAAHRGPCEVLPPRCSTLPPIPRMTHSSSLLPTVPATNRPGEKVKASLSDHLDRGAMTDYKSYNHIKSADFTTLERAAIGRHMSGEFQVKSNYIRQLFSDMIMTQLCKLNLTVVMWAPLSRNPIVIDTGCREDGDRGCRRYLQKGPYSGVNYSRNF